MMFVGPLPTLGIDATWVASRRVYFEARAQYLTGHIHDFSGSLGIYEVDALYRYRPNVYFALGYSELRARLTSSKTNDGGFFDLTCSGPQMFFRIAF